MDTVGFRTFGGCAARYARLGTRPAERYFHHDFAGSNGAWGVIWGFAASMAGVSYALLGAAVLFLASLLLAAQLFDHRLINAPSL
jgi:hypothetical protein